MTTPETHPPLPFNVLVQGRYGPIACNRHDMYVGASLIRYGEFSEHEAALFRRLIPVGGVAIDAGANIGALTVPLAQHVGEEGRVYAYEPQRLAFQLLCGNVALNSLANVVARQAALGAARGTIAVPFLDPNATNNVGGVDLRQSYDGAPTETVPLKPLDDFGMLTRLDFLKADVEGAELDVLIGARELITAHHPILYLEADRQEHLNAILDTLRVYGYPIYRIFAHRPPLFNPANFNRREGSIFVRDGNEVVSINLLAFPAVLEELPDLSGIPYLVPLLEAMTENRQQAEEAAA